MASKLKSERELESDRKQDGGGGGIKVWATAQREEKESPETSDVGGSRNAVRDH